jgi:hypothetical protein
MPGTMPLGLSGFFPAAKVRLYGAYEKAWREQGREHFMPRRHHRKRKEVFLIGPASRYPLRMEAGPKFTFAGAVRKCSRPHNPVHPGSLIMPRFPQL